MTNADRISGETDKCCSEAIELTRRFIHKIEGRLYLTYEDEIVFFGEKSLYSYCLLLQAGYVDESGAWLREPPEYSLLCRLIRRFRRSILMRPCHQEQFFCGPPGLRSGTEKLVEAASFLNIAYMQANFSEDECKARTVILKYRLAQKVFDFPVFVNGISLARLLGFRRTPTGRIEIPPPLMAELLKSMQSTRAKKTAR